MQHHHYPFPELFSSCKTETLYPLNNVSPYFLATTMLLSVSINVITLGTAYEQNHTAFVLLCLAYFT